MSMDNIRAPYCPRTTIPLQYCTCSALHEMDVRYDPPPVPGRQFDWHATEKGYEPGMPVGYGSTEQGAIADLQEQVEDREDTAKPVSDSLDNGFESSQGEKS